MNVLRSTGLFVAVGVGVIFFIRRH